MFGLHKLPVKICDKGLTISLEEHDSHGGSPVREGNAKRHRAISVGEAHRSFLSVLYG
jgi:hypothetical protein